MAETDGAGLLRRCFQRVHGCAAGSTFGETFEIGAPGRIQATVGYRRASAGDLFLERYLDVPVEQAVSQALCRAAPREQIVEIGSLAADGAFALVELWGSAANDLGGDCEVAVATLTAPLRAMFARIGLHLVELAPARADRADDPAAWGRYYESDPRVCAGLIADGQRAISAFLSRRRRFAA